MAPRNVRLFIGNLPFHVTIKDLEKVFQKFGDIAFIDLKSRRGPPFAFVEFRSSRDAEDALSRDGYDLDGYKLRVEFPKGRERGRGGAFLPNQRNEGANRKFASRRTKHRIMISGLPASGSWQDVKDHMRVAGDVCYADVYRDGTGVVEFYKHSDVEHAMEKLDNSRFKSHEGEVSYIRLREDSGPSHSRCPTRSRSRSYSRSVSRSISTDCSSRSSSCSSSDRSRSTRRTSRRSPSASRSDSSHKSRRRHGRNSPATSSRSRHATSSSDSCSTSQSRSRSRSMSQSSRSTRRSPSPSKPKSKSRSRSPSTSISSESSHESISKSK